MDENYKKCYENIDNEEALTYFHKALEFISQGKPDDAIAYSIAMGFKMGYDACKNQSSNQQPK